jgi:hypothetical protein
MVEEVDLSTTMVIIYKNRQLYIPEYRRLCYLYLQGKIICPEFGGSRLLRNNCDKHNT